MPGTPEACAYAMPTGTSMVVMTMPATTSCLSQDGSYRRRVSSPGSQRIQPVWVVCAAWRAMRPGSVTLLLPAALFHSAEELPGRRRHRIAFDLAPHLPYM